MSMCIWGMSWSSAKVLSSYGEPMSIAFIRVSITFLALIPVMVLMKKTVIVKKKGVMYVAGAGLCLICYAFLFFKGLSLGLSGVGGVIVTTISPLFAYIISILVKRKIPENNEIKGLVFGLLAGLTLLQVWKAGQSYFSSGLIYFFIAALVWAIMSKFSSQANKYGNIIGFSWWMHLITLLGFVLIVDLQEILYIITNGDRKFWLNMLYFGIVNSTIATTIYLYSTTIVGPEKAGSFMFIVPVSAVFFSWLFLEEKLEVHTFIGGILGIAAVMLINKKSDQRVSR